MQKYKKLFHSSFDSFVYPVRAAEVVLLMDPCDALKYFPACGQQLYLRSNHRRPVIRQINHRPPVLLSPSLHVRRSFHVSVLLHSVIAPLPPRIAEPHHMWLMRAVVWQSFYPRPIPSGFYCPGSPSCSPAAERRFLSVFGDNSLGTMKASFAVKITQTLHANPIENKTLRFAPSWERMTARQEILTDSAKCISLLEE